MSRVALFSLLVVLGLPACAPDEPRLAAGTWSLDKDASRESTVPLWRVEASERFEQELDEKVKPLPVALLRMKRGQLAQRQETFDEEVKRALAVMEATLEVQSGGRFVFTRAIPGFEGTANSGTVVVTEAGEVHLALREQDGQPLDAPSRLSGRLDDQGRLVLALGEFYLLVFAPPR